MREEKRDERLRRRRLDNDIQREREHLEIPQCESHGKSGIKAGRKEKGGDQPPTANTPRVPGGLLC